MTFKSTSILLPLLIVVCISGCSSWEVQADQSQDNANDDFIALFKAELENRMLARVITHKLSTSTSHPESQEFWLAYFQLENENYHRYLPVAESYGLSLTPDWKTNSKAFLSKIAFKIFPELMVEKIYLAVQDYLPSLHRLKSLSPPAQEKFFNWVVKQEQAQLTAFSMAVEGNYLQAAELLNEIRTAPY